jgi:NAD(P)-dependent dehydrogenase (short-subunit alcohol dehydrogenase family)
VRVAAIGRNQRRAATLPSSVRFFATDLSKFSDIRQTAAAIRGAYGSIDILVNNAGARFSTYGITAEGIERTFAVNHLGHFLLTALLLDRIIASGAGRVITVASSAHGDSNGEWLLTADRYDRRMAYATSKLANLMFTYDLAIRLAGTGVVAHAIDPGGVATNLGRNNGLLAWVRHLTYYAGRFELRSPARAARLVTQVAVASETAPVSGRYYAEGGEMASSPMSHDRRRAAELWALSVALTHLDASLGLSWAYVNPAGLLSRSGPAG